MDSARVEGFFIFDCDALEKRTMATARTPATFLKEALGRPVSVRLNSGDDYKGALRSFRPAPSSPLPLPPLSARFATDCSADAWAHRALVAYSPFPPQASSRAWTGT